MSAKSRARTAAKSTGLALVTILLVTQLVGPAAGCGPGSGAGRRRAGKKMTPLVFKQHVPNVSEHSLGGSGPAEGRVSATDPRFAGLVINNSPDVLFKDADGTGSDRVMTQRCREKLNTLAILVINQWPGVKVRVTAGWADDPILGPVDSLHYEGRAVDITTSDRDRSKYGLLARLAVEAGFDWVYYESRGHIHCSVKSDSSIAIGSHGCFPRHSTVTLENGRTVRMDELAVGDKVTSFDPATGRLESDEVVTFLDRSDVVPPGTVFVSVETELGHQLTLTAAHLIYTADSATAAKWHQPSIDFNSLPVVFADRLSVGDYVFVGGNESTVVPAKISRLTTVTSRDDAGVYAPLTSRGTIVVDGVVASCYASFGDHGVAHLSTLPLRLLESLRRRLESVVGGTRTSADGVHWYAETLRTIGAWVLPADSWYVSV